VSLSRALERGDLRNDTAVIVKVLQTDDQGLIDKIVLTTNNQNAIHSRDLRSNDAIQVDYQRAFLDQYDLFYERKVNEFKGYPPRTIRGKLVSNESVARAFLAIVRKRPTIARTQRYRVWSDELYEQVFPATSVERHVLSYLVYSYCNERRMIEKRQGQTEQVKLGILLYGAFHLARIVGRLYTGTEEWVDKNATEIWIHDLRTKPDILETFYIAAVELLSKILVRHPDMMEEISNAFKAGEIEAEINRALNPRQGSKQAGRGRSRASTTGAKASTTTGANAGRSRRGS